MESFQCAHNNFLAAEINLRGREDLLYKKSIGDTKAIFKLFWQPGIGSRCAPVGIGGYWESAGVAGRAGTGGQGPNLGGVTLRPYSLLVKGHQRVRADSVIRPVGGQR